MSDTLTMVFSLVWKFVLLMVIVATGIFFASSTSMNDITKAYAEMTAVTGGFTNEQYNLMISDLAKVGFPESKLDIKITATNVNGNDITNQCTGVTNPNANPYPINPKFCKRGSRIVLEISSTETAYINGVYKFLGIKSDIKKAQSRRVYMSERVD